MSSGFSASLPSISSLISTENCDGNAALYDSGHISSAEEVEEKLDLNASRRQTTSLDEGSSKRHSKCSTRSTQSSQSSITEFLIIDADDFGMSKYNSEKNPIYLCKNCWIQRIKEDVFDNPEHVESAHSFNNTMFDFKLIRPCSPSDEVEVIQEEDLFPLADVLAIGAEERKRFIQKSLFRRIKHFVSRNDYQVCDHVSPTDESYNRRATQEDINKAQELMKKNVHIPRVRDADTVESCVNPQNVLSMPSRMSCQLAPTSTKIKVVITGSSGVGKTTIVFNRTDEQAVAYNSTIGASYFNFDLKVNDVILHLQVWDTAGQERFRCMVPMYVRNAAAAIVVYDVTNRKSFDEIDSWVAEIQRIGSEDFEPNLIIVGNKADLESSREVAVGEGYAKATKLNAKFYEVAALNSTTTSALFAYVAEGIYERDKELGGAWKATDCLRKRLNRNGGGVKSLSLSTKRTKASTCCAVS